LLAGGFAQPQCEADGQDIYDRQLQQPRHHRGIHFYVFLRSDTQHAVGKLRQRRIVTRYGDDRRAVFLGDAYRIQKLDGRTRIGHGNQHVLVGQHGGGHQLGVGIHISHGGNAETEEFVLCILRHDARIADAVKFHAPRVQQHGDGVFQLRLLQNAALSQNRGGGIAQYFFHHAGHVVVGIQLFMHIRHPFVADAGGQCQFEFRQPFVTQAAAEADDRRLAHRCALGDFGHRSMDKPFGFRQRPFRHFALGSG